MQAPSTKELTSFWGAEQRRLPPATESRDGLVGSLEHLTLHQFQKSYEHLAHMTFQQLLEARKP